MIPEHLPVVQDDSNRKILTNRAESVKQELPKYWDRDYINQRLNAIQDSRQRMLITFLWMTGLRITEAVSLKKGNIDFANCTMQVRHLKSKKHQHRIIPLHPQLKDQLFHYTATMILEDRVFPITRQRAFQITSRLLGGSPHRLRHSFAVNWLRCGGDIVTLHRILGHSKIQTTMEYLRIVPIDLGKELAKIQFTEWS